MVTLTRTVLMEQCRQEPMGWIQEALRNGNQRQHKDTFKESGCKEKENGDAGKREAWCKEISFLKMGKIIA